MKLTTRRLILREFRPSDFDSIHEFASDAETTLYMDWGPNDRKATRAFLKTTMRQAREKPRQWFVLAITRKSDGKHIGNAGIRIESAAHRSGSFGYILHKDEWGKGYATEAARAITDFGFKKLKLHRVWATCRTENKASARVLKKIGLRYEGRMKEDKLIRGRFVDSLLFAKTRPSRRAIK